MGKIVGFLFAAVLLVAVAVPLFGAGAAQAAPPTATKALVYTGNNALNEGYSKFATEVAKDGVTTTDVLGALPADLSVYRCIVLPINRSAYSGAQIAQFSTYLNSGGRIIALAEWSGFSTAIATQNGLAAGLSSGLSVVSALIDSGFTVTPNIDASPFTAGVTTIRFGLTSEISVGGAASSLVRTLTGAKTFIGADPIGSGFFFLSGDSNWISNNSADAYTAHDNPTLVRNLCSASVVVDVDIDIKPGSDPNCIKDTSKGKIPVAILSTASFDATTVDPATIKIDGVAPVRSSANKDVDGDGLTDLVSHFRTTDLLVAGLLNDGATLSVTGALNDGTPIVGSDIIFLAGGPNCLD